MKDRSARSMSPRRSVSGGVLTFDLASECVLDDEGVCEGEGECGREAYRMSEWRRSAFVAHLRVESKRGCRLNQKEAMAYLGDEEQQHSAKPA